MESLHRGMYYADITDPEAIASNRRGELTPRQERLIRDALAPRRSSIFMGAAASIGFLVFVAVVLFNAWPTISSPKIAIVTVWLPLLIFGGIALVVELIFIGMTLRASHDVRSTIDDLRQHRVAGADGTVEWGSGLYGIKTYIARIGRRQLRAPVYSLQLPPGSYFFYYLDRSGWLLSAQATAPPAPAQPVVPFGTLAYLHGFTPEDTAINQSGRLSARQRMQRLIAALYWFAPAFGLGMLVLAGLAFRGVSQPVPEQIAVAALMIGMAAFCGYQGYRRAADLFDDRPVRAAEGVLRIRHQVVYRSHNVYYVIGGREFELSSAMISRQAYNSIIEQHRYRVYYLEHSQIIVSLEPLPETVLPPGS